VNQKLGFAACVTGELWKDHPEKALVLRADRVARNPRAADTVTAAAIEAQQWCDKLENKEEMAAIIGKPGWFNVPVAKRYGDETPDRCGQPGRYLACGREDTGTPDRCDPVQYL
jgi:nitrate/nitrite transport system substrate-binding protein